MPTQSPLSSTGQYPRNVKKRFVAGAAAGNVTVTGIKVGDVLLFVGTTDASAGDLTSEFTVTAANTIDNTGGTSTATKVLLVEWATRDSRA